MDAEERIPWPAMVDSGRGRWSSRVSSSGDRDETHHRALNIAAHFSASHHHHTLPIGPTRFLLSLAHFGYIMPYNREWDRGKQPDGSWQYQGGATHPRDDEYYGDGKRRKFNNGVRLRLSADYTLILCGSGL